MFLGAGATNALTARNDAKGNSLIALAPQTRHTALTGLQDASTLSMAWAGLNLRPMKRKFGMVVGLIVINLHKYISRHLELRGNNAK